MSDKKHKHKHKRPSIPKYHSLIKWDIVKSLSLKNKTAVLDLAIGRGGDLNKYSSKSEIDTIYGIDIDNNAIIEARSRWDNNKSKLKPKLLLLNEDAASHNVRKWISSNTRRKFGLTVCNFAIHYFFKSKETLESLALTMSKFTKKGGILWISCPDGKQLLNLLGKDMEKKTPAYSLRKIPSSVKFKYYGDKIEYKLNNTTYFNSANPGKDIMRSGISFEYLINIDELIRVLEQYNFKLKENNHFSHWSSKVHTKLKSYEKEISYTNVSLIFVKC